MTCPALDLWIAGGIGAVAGAVLLALLIAVAWAQEMGSRR